MKIAISYISVHPSGRQSTDDGSSSEEFEEEVTATIGNNPEESEENEGEDPLLEAELVRDMERVEAEILDDEDSKKNRKRRWIPLFFCFPCQFTWTLRQKLAAIFCCCCAASAAVATVTVVVVIQDDDGSDAQALNATDGIATPTPSPANSQDNDIDIFGSQPTLAPTAPTTAFPTKGGLPWWTENQVDLDDRIPPLPEGALGQDGFFGRRIGALQYTVSPATYLVAASFGLGEQTYEWESQRSLLPKNLRSNNTKTKNRHLAMEVRSNKLITYSCQSGQDFCVAASYISATYSEPWEDFSLTHQQFGQIKIVFTVNGRVFLYDFGRRGLDLWANGVDVEAVYGLPVELRTNVADPLRVKVPSFTNRLFVSSKTEMVVFRLTASSGDALTTQGADAYTTGWNGENLERLREYQTGSFLEEISTIHSDGGIVAIGVNVVPDSGLASSDACHSYGTCFLGYSVRVLDADNDVQVGQSFTMGTGWSVVSVALSNGGRLLAIATIQEGHPTVLRTYWRNSGDVSSTAWKLLGQENINADGRVGNDYGRTLSWDDRGDILVVGAPREISNTGRQGRIYSYQLSESVVDFYANPDTQDPTWDLLELSGDSGGLIVGPSPEATDFASSIGLSDDGNLLVVGAPANDFLGRHTGSLKVYQGGG